MKKLIFPEKHFPFQISKMIFRCIIVIGIWIFPAIQSVTVAQTKDVPYVPTPYPVVEKMLDMAGVGPGDYVIDLGSGDGRIVINAALRGAVGHGVDIDPVRIREANENARSAKVDDNVLFIQENIFETDFSKADVITMYLLSRINMKLRPVLLKKLKPGTKLVSHSFSMSDWEPDESADVNEHSVYFWIVPAQLEGEWQWTTGQNKFMMQAQQKFQKIKLDVTSGNSKLMVENAFLSGDKISFRIIDRSNGYSYLFNGHVHDNTITGTAQIRNKNKKDRGQVESWKATLN